MPFPGHARLITIFFQDFSQRGCLQAEVYPHSVYSGILGIMAGQQGSPARTTPGTIVHLGEADPRLCQPVDVRRIDFPTVTSQVGIAHVIQHDNEHIGSFCFAVQVGLQHQACGHCKQQNKIFHH